VWIAFALFLFSARLCRKNISRGLTSSLVVFHVLVYVTILTVTGHNLYYKNIQFITKNGMLFMTHGNGFVHDLFMFVQCTYVFIGIGWIIAACYKEKNKETKRRLLMVIIAFSVEGFFFLVQILGLFGVTGIYDVSMIGHFLGNVIIFIAIFRHDLLGTSEIAREYMIDRISEAIIATDKEGVVQYFNKPAKHLFPDLSVYDRSVPAAITEALDKDGRITINERIYIPEENDLVHNGDHYGTLYALVDETEHIRYMKELEEQKEIADSANAAKSRFLANMSHEIRTPINAVLGMDEMILRESSESPIRAYASDIMSAGRTLLSLINDILDLSKVEEGKMEIIPVQYELSSIVNDLSNMIRDRALRKGLKFHVDVNEHIPRFLFGDEIRIKQCALNVLTNAVKYTETGSVDMRISYEKKDDSHILLDFTISDTGIGMHKEDIDKLFSPYERLEEKRNRTIEGTGLGMTITRQLLDLMGSRLEVESEYGKGTTINFSIEQEVVAWEEIGDFSKRFNSFGSTAHTYKELFHAPLARILIVDDTEMNLTVIQSLLKKTQLRIDTALSGKDALTLAEVNPYDVIFIDHMMPDMDGVETLKHLRELEKNQTTPAVALTANAVSGARQKYLSAGFDDYLSKPVDGAKLEKMLLHFIPEDKIEGKITVAENAGPATSEKPCILTVDDDESVQALVKSLMEPQYAIESCLLGEKAVSLAKKTQPDLILLDIHLTDTNGFTVMKELKENELTADIPILLITGDKDTETEENAFVSGASDYVRKPFAPEVLKARVKRIIDLHHYQQSIEKEVERQTRRSRRLSREMMLALSKTVDTKDHYTDGHSRRVGAICAEIGRRLGKSAQEQIDLYAAGLLHDIGKIGIHEDIIRKTSRLDEQEFLIVKAHTTKGYEILKEITDMPKLWECARWHHERYDGSGYPDGRKGEEIPEAARIACIADCYDAMTSTRTYSVPKKQSDVRAEIVRCRGTWFDPQIADVMLAMIDEDTDYKMNEHAGGSDVWKEYDRLWGNLSQVEKAVDPESVQLPAWLYDVPEMDIAAGVKNCGSKDGYLAVLTVFHQTAENKAAEIEEAFRAGDLANYTIRVHALKSSARIIGAAELSKLAADLEEAGREENTDRINQETDRLLRMYRHLNENLSGLDTPEEMKPEIGPEEMKEAYQTIGEIAESMDYGLMDTLLKDLRGYSLGQQDAGSIAQIETQLTDLDWEGIARTAKEAAVR
ncbi:MAG: response regulator, partial [Lachnospiraceae bacterium]|nr:response regulator [Lachnospiraceae bacterium]